MHLGKNMLDPIGTMCRLIMLKFRSIGTKISSNNNAIVIQQASSVQWIYRKINGDDRDDISDLFVSVVSIIEWFIIPLYNLKYHNKRTKLNCDLFSASEYSDVDVYMNIDEQDVNEYWNCIIKLVKYMCMGLSNLQETYGYGNAVWAIQYYINILNDAVGGNYLRDKLPHHIKAVEQNYIKYQDIKDLWNYRKIKEICDLYDKCFESYSESEKIEGYLKAISHILHISENAFRDLVVIMNS